VLLVASAHALPRELSGVADEVRIQFPWGSLLDAVLGADGPTIRGIVELMRRTAELVVLLSVVERDGVDRVTRLDAPTAERVATDVATIGGLRVVECRPASAGEVAGAHSTWAKRLAVGRSRPAWVLRLRRIGQTVDEDPNQLGGVVGTDPDGGHAQLALPDAEDELPGVVVPGDAQELVDAAAVGHEHPVRERPPWLRHDRQSARLPPVNAVTIVDGRLEWRPHDDPNPGPAEVLVAVQAAGVSRADVLQRDGLYPPPPGTAPDIPGLDLAGEVAAVGAGVSRFAAGDRVMAVVPGGGQAELCVVHERVAIAVPGAMSWAQAGAFPENYTTAHDALFTQCGLAMGERVCIHGAAGGVGTAAVELAVAAGCSVVGTVRHADLRERVAALGATAVAPDEFVDHGPFDVILELVGASNLTANLEALATKGRVAIIGVGAGASGQLDLLALMGKRGRIVGSTLRTRPLEDKADAARRIERHVLPLVEAGRISVPIAETLPMRDAQTAYGRFEQGGKFGRIVLVRD
jgi:putative PIG3 family NAD(P)H quinone oxidoreductase